jgi:uncharacterized protein (TIGR03437 family)
MAFRRSVFLLIVLLGIGGISQAGVTQINSSSNLNANASVDWGALYTTTNSDFYPPRTVSVTGITGLTLTASMSLTDAELMRIDAGTVSGTTWTHGFTSGTKLLWTAANYTGVHAPLDLILSRPVYGIGMHIDNNFYGTYTATIAAYDASDTLLGTFNWSGTTGAGLTGPFLGVLSSELNIKRVRISTTGSSTNSGDANDFVIDGPVIYGADTSNPIITALTNNYSYIVPGMPNYGIAQGSIFILYGYNLGPATLTSQSFPLQTTFSGVQINVTVGGTTVQALPYYVSVNQLAAVLPSTTPVGTGTITVTYNGLTGDVASIKVVASAPGILAVYGATGRAQATDNPLYNLLNYTNSANPGDYVSFWGSGLGAVSGDETNIRTVTQLTGLDLKVYVGGKEAYVQWAGRSQFPGLDQINVQVPSGVAGCEVSVFFKVGSMIGNSVTIPVAASGHTCSSMLPALDGSKLQAFLDAGTLRVGVLAFDRVINADSNGAFDWLWGGFATIYPQQLSTYGKYVPQIQPGSCEVTTAITTYGGADTDFPGYISALDGGTPLTLSADPGSTLQVAKNSKGFYTKDTTPGTTISTVGTATTITGSFPGGTDVSAVRTSVSLPVPLTWTNRTSLTTVDRSQPLTITWAGAPAGSWVIIRGTSYLADWISPSYSTFTCLANAEDLAFTVPAYVLAALPATPSSFPIPTSLSVANGITPASFTATGIQVGVFLAASVNFKSVTFK